MQEVHQMIWYMYIHVQTCCYKL